MPVVGGTGIKEISISELKKKPIDELRFMESVKVMADGKFIGFWVVPQTGHIHNALEGMVLDSNNAISEKNGYVKERWG